MKEIHHFHFLGENCDFYFYCQICVYVCLLILYLLSIFYWYQRGYIKQPYWEVHQQPQQRPSDIGSRSSDEGSSSEIEESTNPSFLIQMNGKTHDASGPWWRRKTAKITEIEPEMKETKQFPYGMGTSEGPSQRRWIPPQPPAISIPDAAAGIRRPKTSAQKQQQSGDEQSAASSDDGEERMVKAPASAVEVETSSVTETNQTEIQEERADGIEVN